MISDETYTPVTDIMSKSLKRKKKAAGASLKAPEVACYQALLKIKARGDWPPSFQELGDELGYTRSGAFRLITKLERKGLVGRKPDRSRGLYLTAEVRA